MRIHTTFIFYLFVLLFIFIITNNKTLASPGDTTTVFVHDKTDMTWNLAYDEMGYFPDGTTQYNKVLMTYTLGCASDGCSDWDYTTLIEAMIPTGTYDSTFVMVDPMTMDTTWNVFEVMNPLELARVITPYGRFMRESENGYTPDWEHDYVFDVTDFVPLLRDSVMIRAFYDGWSTGFAVSLRFDFIEGTPPLDVIDIQSVYSGRGDYTTGGFGFEIADFYAKTVDIPANSDQHKLRVTISGHGFTNNVNCAEFCIRDYSVNVDGNKIGEETLWRDDCGFNPIHPQGGTWIYNRANWCPGSRVTTHEFDLTPYVQAGSTAEIDLDMEVYFWSGDQNPIYIYSAQLVSYGTNNHTTDAAITDIINPTLSDIHGRVNPACNEPTIKIRNEGSETLTSADIFYGVKGAASCTHTWTGSLAFMEEAEVTLPSISWTNYDADNRIFNAEITTANGASDQNTINNKMSSAYEIPPMLPDSFIIYISTSNAGSQTSYRIEDVDGNIVGQRAAGSLANNQTYQDEFRLDPGCYVLRIFDSGGDGLGWGFNPSQGTGYARIRRMDAPFNIISFNSDFGSQIYYQFTIGDLANAPHSGNCTTISNEDILLENSQLQILPNPNTGIFTLQLTDVQLDNAQLTILNTLGQTVQQKGLGNINGMYNENVNLETMPKGIYFVNIQHDEGQFSQKVIIK